MRISAVVIVAGLAVGVACAGSSVTPSRAEPQRTSTVATPSAATLYLINGKELAPGHTLQELDPRTVTSVEHFIGPAARLHGAAPGRDVVLITTTDTLAVARMTKS